MTAMEQKANKAEIDAVSGEVLTSWQRQVRSIMSAASRNSRSAVSERTRSRVLAGHRATPASLSKYSRAPILSWESRTSLPIATANSLSVFSAIVPRIIRWRHLPKGPNPKAIYVLDELTNENKHRTPLITGFVTHFKTDEPPPFRHVELEVTR